MSRSLLPPSLFIALFGVSCIETWKGVDNDGDGYSVAQGDCWDSADGPPGSGLTGGDINPGADDKPYDGIDQDCAGNDDYDLDGDGWVKEESHVGKTTLGVSASGNHEGWGDCWNDPDRAHDSTEFEHGMIFTNVSGDQVGPADVFPGATDTWYDGPDQDCGFNSDFDQDGDGHDSDKVTPETAELYGIVADDCVDRHPDDNPDANLANLPPEVIYTGATEVLYDGTDQDCSGVYSAGNSDIVADCDADQDGAPVANNADVADDSVCLDYEEDPDCNDNDSRAVPDPSIPEIFYNGVDDNCAPTVGGVPDTDGDADRDTFWDIDYFEKVPTPGPSVDTSEAEFTDCWDDPDNMPTNEDGEGIYEGEPIYAFDPHADPDDSTAFTEAFAAGSLTAAEVNPAAWDRPYDGVDQDCAGDATLDNEYDWDGDGERSEVQWYTDPSTGNYVSGDDCTDCSSRCDGIDAADPAYDFCLAMCDNDAYVTLDIGHTGNINPAGLDSDQINPDATETWYDGTDQDCRRDIDYDRDGDYVPPGTASLSDIEDQGESRLAYYDWAAVSSQYQGLIDCNDNDATISPTLVGDDVWYDGVDTDCAGNDDYDQDYDGYVEDEHVGAKTYQSQTADEDYFVTESLNGDDCIDTDSSYNPSATDTWYDGFDNDCQDNDDYDQDADGVASEAEASSYGPTYHGATEAVAALLDTDDCDDTDASISPAGSETWYDGVDSNCDEKDDWDADEDGHALEGTTVAYGPTVNESGSIPGTGSLAVDDCNDEDDVVYTGATDVWYDGVDNDCAGNDDYDQDADGFASLIEASDYDTTYQSSTFDSSYALSSTGSLTTDDCNDEEDVIKPGAADTWFDNVDQDCDNEDDFDQDYDGYVDDAYVGEVTYQSEVLNPDYLLSSTGSLPGNDCVEGDASYNPVATDTWYDGKDNDCQDNDDWDRDEDGHAAEGTAIAYGATYHASDAVAGTGTLSDDDCNDTDDEVYFGATDIWYDGIDNDCAGNDDYDQDADGYASSAEASDYDTTYQSTTFESAYAVSSTGSAPTDDCNDTDALVNTGVGSAEVWYDGVDQDCDGADDYDQDGDGYVPTEYVGLSTYQSDSSSLGYIVPGTGGLPGDDCVDDDGAYNPGATDTWYDGLDHDCADNDDWDSDEDSHAAEGTAIAYDVTYQDSTAVPGTGGLSVDDCNDVDSAIYTGATDVWYDGIDHNCDEADDYDQDSDGYASLDEASSYDTTYQSTTFASAYAVSATGSLAATDCNDEELVINPGASDTWRDGIDHDCGGEDDYDPDFDLYVADAYVGVQTYQSATGDSAYLLGSTGSLPGDDCVDDDATYNPGATDAWYDGFDKDCADNDDWDQDVDNHAAEGTATAYGATYHDTDAVSGTGSLSVDDCNDTDNAVYTGATDVWYDGIDSNCDEADDFDRDADGFASLAEASSYDTTYQSTTFASAYAVSTTGGLAADDCNDEEMVINPGASDSWRDGIDHDCGGEDDYDPDLDGYVADAYVGDQTYQSATSDADYLLASTGALPGDDCVDDNSAYNPGVTDVWYDGNDTDCQDNDDWDADEDSHAADDYTASYTTTKQDGTVVAGTGSLPVDDCNDTEDDVYFGHLTDNWYDGTDSDCDGADDYDADGDGYVPDVYSGRSTYQSYDDTTSATWRITTSSIGDGDCLDIDAFGETASEFYPGATDAWYDGQDKNCQGDDDYDADTDLFVDDAYVGDDTYVAATRVYTATGTNGGECNDEDSAVYPGATDTWYDGIDSDCDDADDFDADDDGTASLAEASSYATTYQSTTFDSAYAVSGTGSLTASDCNDFDGGINTSATEVCDASNVDEDCDTLADNNDPSADPATKTTYYEDNDGDTYGGDGTGTLFCDLPATGYVATEADCDDSDASINDSAAEVVGDEIDQNCDGAETCYYDADTDGYVVDLTYTVASVDTDCTDSTELTLTLATANTGDCDDTQIAVNPGATEICDSLNTDEDCSGAADDADGGVDTSTYNDWYIDVDGDGYGDENDTPVAQCDQPSGRVDNNEDCDDSDPAYSPDATESQDGEDNDCDDYIDEGTITADSEYLLVTEIMIDPDAVGDPLGEWFEIHNPNAFDVVVDDSWVFYDNAVGGYTVPAPVTIVAGGYETFVRNTSNPANGGVSGTGAWANDGIGLLANTSDSLTIGFFDPDDPATDTGDSATAVIVDTVAWDTSGGWTVPAGASLQLTNDSAGGYPREGDATDNSDPSVWCAATIAWSTSVGDFGSPTDDNEDCTP